MSTPKVFLTDYASYNEGKQFEFGHWVDLDDFADADDLRGYIKAHFEEANKKSPSIFREETMFTDFEGFPRELYSESGIDFDALYQYLDLEEYEQVAVACLLDNGFSISEALEKYEDIHPCEFDRYGDDKYYLFEEMYPDAEKVETQNPYITIDYDRFIREEYTEFEIDGKAYLVADYEMQ